MVEIDVRLSNVAGTQAALGWAGAHTIVADRPPGKAGGQGLGFNGGQLLALAIGGCFCNDLRYAADELGVEIDGIDVAVQLTLEGRPLVVTAANVTVCCVMAGGKDPISVIEHAKKNCTVSNSLSKGVPVTFVHSAEPAEKSM